MTGLSDLTIAALQKQLRTKGPSAGRLDRLQLIAKALSSFAGGIARASPRAESINALVGLLLSARSGGRSFSRPIKIGLADLSPTHSVLLSAGAPVSHRYASWIRELPTAKAADAGKHAELSRQLFWAFHE